MKINFIPIKPYQSYNNIERNKYRSYEDNNFNTTIKDTFSYRVSELKMTSTEKLTDFAIKLLKQQGLKEGQQVYITGNSEFLPVMNALSQEAYKQGSGRIKYKVIEPELEDLKKRYNITEEFDYVETEINYLKENGALFINLNDTGDLYKKIGLSEAEIKSELDKICCPVPKSVTDLFKINPNEIFIEALDIHKGQPVKITAEREHLPFVIKLVEWLYSQNSTKLVDVSITNDADINMLKYAKEEVLENYPPIIKDIMKEGYEKDVACLVLDGGDPNRYENIQSDRIVKNNKARNSLIREYYTKTISNIPWLVYYAPTTKSCAKAYPEFSNPIDALKQAYKDANEINRMGKLDAHIKSLNYRSKRLNEILQDGYRTFHYVSIDPETNSPDGKTDFKITMSPKSIFNAARVDMDLYGHKPLVNIPTEEVFTAPQNDTAQGVISATLPLSLNGKIVEGIKFTFDKGRIVDIKADKNEDMLKNHIKAFKNADRLGEVAFVADSPIAKTGRLFNSTLLDENAACHLAIGSAYPDTVKEAAEIENIDEMQKYLNDLKINTSDTHIDFMVGGKNVNIYAINDKTNQTIPIIENDKFLI